MGLFGSKQATSSSDRDKARADKARSERQQRQERASIRRKTEKVNRAAAVAAKRRAR